VEKNNKKKTTKIEKKIGGKKPKNKIDK